MKISWRFKMWRNLFPLLCDKEWIFLQDHFTWLKIPADHSILPRTRPSSPCGKAAHASALKRHHNKSVWSLQAHLFVRSWFTNSFKLQQELFNTEKWFHLLMLWPACCHARPALKKSVSIAIIISLCSPGTVVDRLALGAFLGGQDGAGWSTARKPRLNIFSDLFTNLLAARINC